MNACKSSLILLIALTGFLFSAFSQNETSDSDSNDTINHSPKRAAVYSAVLPGLGQAYNRKYWKIPIVYGAFGIVTYFYIDNNRQYKTYKQAYKLRTDDDPDTNDEFTGIYTDDNLKVLREYYRRNMELTLISGFAVYLLNIIDASVDAHLFDFDVNEDLSMRIEPFIIPEIQSSTYMSGIKLSLKF